MKKEYIRKIKKMSNNQTSSEDDENDKHSTIKAKLREDNVNEISNLIKEEMTSSGDEFILKVVEKDN